MTFNNKSLKLRGGYGPGITCKYMLKCALTCSFIWFGLGLGSATVHIFKGLFRATWGKLGGYFLPFTIKLGLKAVQGFGI